MITYKEARQRLETMTAEPEGNNEARLSADELDAVLLAIDLLKCFEFLDKVNETIDNAILHGSAVVPDHLQGWKLSEPTAQPHGHWVNCEDPHYWGGGYTECSNCKMRFAFGAYHEAYDFYYCPDCGSINREGGNA